MHKYSPGSFADLAYKPVGKNIWKFLNEYENVLRMVTASELGRPAVEAVADKVLDKFGAEVRNRRVKQMVGHMVRQIMEYNGFQLDATSVRVRSKSLFSFAARYRKINQNNR